MSSWFTLEVAQEPARPQQQPLPTPGGYFPPNGLRGLQVCHNGFRGLLSHGPPYPHAEQPSELLPLVSGHPAKDGERPGEALLTLSLRSHLRETEATAGPETRAEGQRAEQGPFTRDHCGPLTQRPRDMIFPHHLLNGHHQL